jgi:hypothetical protein
MRVSLSAFQLSLLPIIGNIFQPYHFHSGNILDCTHKTFQQILNHMNESALYNETDLVPFHRRLNELRQIVQKDSKQPKALTKLLERQLQECGMSSSSFLHPLPSHFI